MADGVYDSMVDSLSTWARLAASQADEDEEEQ